MGWRRLVVAGVRRRSERGGSFALLVYNNTLVVGGDFTLAGGIVANHIAVWDGVNWSPLGSGLDSMVTALAEYDGKLVTGGYFPNAGGTLANRIAIWDGSSWSPLGSGLVRLHYPSYQSWDYSRVKMP